MNERLLKNLWFAYAVALTTWSICAYMEMGRIYSCGELFAMEREGRPYISDFTVFYNAAKLTNKYYQGDHNVRIYSPETQESSLKEITKPVVAEKPLLAIYPPYFFAMVLPLSLVSLNIAWISWCCVGFFFLLGTLYCLTAGRGTVSRFTRFFVFVAVLGSYPAWLSFRLGQVSLFLPTSLAVFWFLTRYQHYLVAGFVSALCMLKVQYLPALTLVGLILGRLKYATGLFFSLLTLGVVSWSVVGIDNIKDFPAALHYNETSTNVGGVAAAQMQNIRGFLNLVTGSDSPLVHNISMLCFIVISLGIGGLWWHLSKQNILRERFLQASAATVLAILISSPHTHTQDYLAVAPVAIWLWQSTVDDTTKLARWIRYLLIAFPFASWIFFILQPVFALIKVEPFFLWASILLALTIKVIMRKEDKTEFDQLLDRVLG